MVSGSGAAARSGSGAAGAVGSVAAKSMAPRRLSPARATCRFWCALRPSAVTVTRVSASVTTP